MLSPTRLGNFYHQTWSKGLDNSIYDNSVISNHSYVNYFTCDQLHVSCILKMFLATVVNKLQGSKVSTCSSILIMIAALENYSATAPAEKIDRNISIYDEIFANDYLYLSAYVNFSNMLLATINDAVNIN